MQYSCCQQVSLHALVVLARAARQFSHSWPLKHVSALDCSPFTVVNRPDISTIFSPSHFRPYSACCDRLWGTALCIHSHPTDSLRHIKHILKVSFGARKLCSQEINLTAMRVGFIIELSRPANRFNKRIHTVRLAANLPQFRHETNQMCTATGKRIHTV